MTHVTINSDLLHWARKRAGFGLENLRKRFPKLEAWERGEGAPTLKQLEAFAKAVFVPIGYLFLEQPPEEKIPISDLRIMGGGMSMPPSPDLLDVLYLCQRRQAWYRDFARSVAEEPRRFVGSVNIESPVEETAATMREALGFDLEVQRSCPTWTEALREFIAHTEDSGILVMVSGVVGSNNRRKLDPKEFRGFALADEYAPLVFINGSDTKAAQIFTLAHELAHIWLGESAISDVSPASRPSQGIEFWCNNIAAELLVPIKLLKDSLPPTHPLDAVQALARQFKVSTLVILRRIMDAGAISRNIFQNVYDQELERLYSLPKSIGGNFYLTQEARASRRFVQALVISTLEGQTLYRDAFHLLGIKKERTFNEFGTRIGVIL
jgi:Zn-dependent peptidase ImmA (M78 family)/transcriptional regulator with XRE-family HTH domain